MNLPGVVANYHFNAPVPAAQCWHIGGQLAEAGSGYVMLGHCHSAVYVKGLLGGGCFH
jgi:hypothetical protein